MYCLKSRSAEQSTGNKRVPGKVATTRTEDGHKQNKRYNINQRTKEHGTTEEEMEGPLHLEDQGTGNTPYPS